MKDILLTSFLLLAFCFLRVPFSDTYAQTFPPNFFTFTVAEGFNEPTSIAFLGDAYILVSEKSGKIKRLTSGQSQSEDFLKVETETSGERGLQSIVVHPDFPNVPYLFLYYTKEDGTRNRLSRVKIFPDFTPGSEEVLVEFDSLRDGIYHNGGGLSILDDKIYLAIGDQFDLSHSQNLDRYSGKLLRLSLDGAIPEDNPQKEGSLARRSIWSYGLRNPFTMDIDPVTKKIMVNDVGYDSWEEINDASTPFLYFGWPYGEGDISHYNPSIPFVDPVFKYANNIADPESPLETRGCAITSGTFYRPTKAVFPAEYIGKYFFSDVCNGWIRTLDQRTAAAATFATGLTQGTLGLKTSPTGSVYYLNFVQGTLHNIVYDNSEIPRFLRTIDDVVGSLGGNIEVAAYTTGRGGAKVMWLKNGELVQDNESSKLSLPNLTESAAGYYRAVVYNDYGSDSSNIFKVTITEYNSSPQSEIVLGSPGKLYAGGDTIFFSGTAWDLEDGHIDYTKHNWTIQFHHETHFHPGPQLFTSQDRNYFIVPQIGEISTDVWFRIILTVKDSNGATSKTFTDIFPKIITVEIVSEPENMDLLLDGRPVVTPYSFQAVAGGIRELILRRIVQTGEQVLVLSSPSTTDFKFTAKSDSIIALQYLSEEVLSGAFPNPAKSIFTLNVACEKSQPILIKIFTSTGLLCHEELLEAKEGANSFLIDSANLKLGLYYISLEGLSVKKLMKLAIE